MSHNNDNNGSSTPSTIAENNLVRKRLQDGVYKLSPIVLMGSSSSRKTSDIWTFYQSVSSASGESIASRKYACPTCLMVFQIAAQTSNLTRHECYKRRKKDTKNIASTNADEMENVKTKIPYAVFQRMRLSEMALVCLDNRPMHAVEGQGLHALLSDFTAVGASVGKRVSPDICGGLLSAPQTITDRISDLAAQMVEELVIELKRIRGAGSSVDLWTDDYTKTAYLGVTLHYIDGTNTLVERFLGMSHMTERNTALYITAKLVEIFQLYQIDITTNVRYKIKFVTDRGSNVRLAVEDFDQSDGDGSEFEANIHCFIHYTENTVEKMLHSCTQIQEWLSCASDMVHYFKVGAGRRTKLPKTLKTYCGTRWSSALKMFQSILHCWDAISADESGRAMPFMKMCDRSMLERIVDFLKLFSDAIQELEGSKQPTLYKVKPYVLLYTDTYLKIHQEDTGTMLEAMKLAGIEYSSDTSRLNSILKNTHHMATFLHPLLVAPKLHLDENIKSKLIYEITRWAITYSSTQSIAGNSAPSGAAMEIDIGEKPYGGKISASDALSVFTAGALEQASVPPHDHMEAKVKAEWRMYECLKEDTAKANLGCTPQKFVLLDWWQNMSAALPILSDYSKFIHAIPASSAPCERAFSKAGNIVTEKRTNMLPETLHGIMVLQGNWSVAVDQYNKTQNKN